MSCTFREEPGKNYTSWDGRSRRHGAGLRVVPGKRSQRMNLRHRHSRLKEQLSQAHAPSAIEGGETVERCISERSAFEAWKAAVAGGTLRMRRRISQTLDLTKAPGTHEGLQDADASIADAQGWN